MNISQICFVLIVLSIGALLGYSFALVEISFDLSALGCI